MKQPTRSGRAAAAAAAATLLRCCWANCKYVPAGRSAGKKLLDHWRQEHGIFYRTTSTNPNVMVDCCWGACSKRFRPGSYSSEAHIRGHLAREHGWKEFFCEICHVNFTRRPDLTAHFKKKHPGVRPLNVCSIPDELLGMPLLDAPNEFDADSVSSGDLLTALPSTVSSPLTQLRPPNAAMLGIRAEQLADLMSYDAQYPLHPNAYPSATLNNDSSPILWNSFPTVPDTCTPASDVASMMLEPSADTFLTSELLLLGAGSGMGTQLPLFDNSLSQTNDACDLWLEQYKQSQQQLKPVSENVAPTTTAANTSDLPLLFGLSEQQTLDLSAWQLTFSNEQF